MDKEKYVRELAEGLNCDLDYAIKISDSLDDYFFIGQNNREKMINSLINELSISYEEADNIYNVSSSIIAKNIKDKIVHPFKKDN